MRARTEFCRKHTVQVQQRRPTGAVDLVEEGIDVAIRFGRLGDTSFIAHRIGEDPSDLRGAFLR
jgi:DNA-binding transcriptional LysR family regulator